MSKELCNVAISNQIEELIFVRELKGHAWSDQRDLVCEKAGVEKPATLTTFSQAVIF